MRRPAPSRGRSGLVSHQDEPATRGGPLIDPSGLALHVIRSRLASIHEPSFSYQGSPCMQTERLLMRTRRTCYARRASSRRAKASPPRHHGEPFIDGGIALLASKACPPDEQAAPSRQQDPSFRPTRRAFHRWDRKIDIARPFSFRKMSSSTRLKG